MITPAEREAFIELHEPDMATFTRENGLTYYRVTWPDTVDGVQVGYHAVEGESWIVAMNAAMSKGAPLNWDAAKAHFDGVRQIYQDMEGTPGVNTTIALRVTFDPIAKRYNSGERTQDLYDDMMGVE